MTLQYSDERDEGGEEFARLTMLAIGGMGMVLAEPDVKDLGELGVLAGVIRTLGRSREELEQVLGMPVEMSLRVGVGGEIRGQE